MIIKKSVPDMSLAPELVKNCLQTEWMGHNIIFFPETDSTNVQAKLAAGQGAVDGTVVLAKHQTAGRGRRGRSWEGEAGRNLCFTLILRPEFPPKEASRLTLIMAYAVKCAIEKYVIEKNISCGIKWPNDIVIADKKVCGILTELQLEGTAIHHVAIGVGVNVSAWDIPSQLQSTATSLAAHMEHSEAAKLSGAEILADILKVFEREYQAYLRACKDMEAAPDSRLGDGAYFAEFKDKYNACLVNKDREVRVLDPKGEYSGIARGINEAGELLVELADGSTEAVYAGEVSVRGIYGYV